VREILRWELRSPLNLAMVSGGAVLIGLVMKRFYLTWNATIRPGPFGPDVLGSIFRTAFTGDVYLLLALLVPFIMTLAVRLERDEGVALSIYSLPVSRAGVLASKFLAVFLTLFVFLLSTHILIFVLHFAATPGAVVGVLRIHTIPMAFFYASVLLFMISVAAVVSILSPNAYLSIFGGFVVLYLPKFLGAEWFWFLKWGKVLTDYHPATISLTMDPIFGMEFLRTSLLPAIVLAGLYLAIGHWRDVR